MIANSTHFWAELTDAWIDAWLLENTILAGLLATLLVAVSRWVTLRPALSHALWLCVIVKLCCPPLWRWDVPVPELVQELAPHTHDSIGSARIEPRAHRPDESVTFAAPRPRTRSVVTEVEDAALLTELPEPVYQLAAMDLTARVPHAHAAEPSRELGAIDAAQVATMPQAWTTRSIRGGLAIAWSLGSCAALLWLLRGAWRTQRALRQWSAPPEHLQRSVARIARRLGVQAPRLRVVNGITAPFLWSFGRPVLIWPQLRATARSAMVTSSVSPER